MKVKVGNVVYSSEDQSIMLIMSSHDKELVGNMESEATKLLYYDEELSEEYAEKYMANVPESTPMPRDEVVEFSLDMEEQLAKNDHKGGWDDLSIPHLMSRLAEEYAELTRVLQQPCSYEEDIKRDAEDIIAEAADVANFAMMIAGKVRRKQKE